jgi:hypothetical protein
MIQTLCISNRFDVGFYSKGNNIISFRIKSKKVSHSVQIKEEIVGAYGSCGDEAICVAAFDRET